MTDVHFVIPLGGHPSALFCAVWALARSGCDVASVRVVVAARGRTHLDRALRTAWHDLKQSLPRGCPEAGDVRIIEVGDGPRDLGEALWEAVREASRDETPMVCALGGGRHRSVAVTASTVFSLRARQRDRLIDVRYSSSEAERNTGFLFPGQHEQHLRMKTGNLLLARDVEVGLDDIPVPRLRRLLGEPDRPRSFEAAILLGQRSLDAMAAPELVIDVGIPRVLLDGELVPLTQLELVWLGAVALERIRGENDGWVRADDELGVLSQFVDRLRHHAWALDTSAAAVQWALGLSDTQPSPDAMKKLRSRARAALARHVARHAPQHRHLVTLKNRQSRKAYFQRLELDPAFIRFEGLT